jgi:hypothetical protein
MRLKTLLIFGAGYLWGTRAGRDRYQEIVGGVRGFMDSDVVRDVVARIRQPDGSGTPAGDVEEELPEDEEEDQEPYGDEDEDYEDEDYEEEEGDEDEGLEDDGPTDDDEPEEPTEEGRSTGRRGMIRRRPPAGGGGGGSA